MEGFAWGISKYRKKVKDFFVKVGRFFWRGILTATLWVVERFISCPYPLAHKWYGNVFKAKLKAYLRKEFPLKGFDDMFRVAWMSNTMNSEYKSNAIITLLMRANMMAQRDNALRSMCGIQPLKGPVGLVHKIKYEKQSKDNPEIYEPVTDWNSTNNGSITLTVFKHSVEARTTRLASRVSHELVQDLSNHKEICSETFNQIGNVIVNEINSLLVDQFISAVVAECGVVELKGDNKYHLLLTFVNAEAAKMAIKTRRGAGNVLWVSPKTLAMMEDNTESSFVPISDMKGSDVGHTEVVKFVGITANIRVFCTNQLPEDIAILGYRGATDTDTGIIMSPYVPVHGLGMMMNMDSFMPEMRMMTRHGFSAPEEGDPREVNDWRNYYTVLKIKD